MLQRWPPTRTWCQKVHTVRKLQARNPRRFYVDRNALPQAFHESMGKMTSPSGPPLRPADMSFAHLRTILTNRAVEELVDVLFNHVRRASSAPPPTRWGAACTGKAAFAALPQASLGRSPVGQLSLPSRASPFCAGPLPGSKKQSSHATPFATLSEPSVAAMSHARFRRQHDTPSYALGSFAGGSDAAACLIAAHCVLMRAVPCPSASTETSECICATVCRGARVYL